MSDLNKVQLIGNLTKDPEIKTIKETSLCNFSIANNRKYKEKTETGYYDCEVWGKMAEVFNQYMSKGSKVAVSGRLKFSSWDDENGKKKSKISIFVEEFQFLNSKNNSVEASLEDSGEEIAF